MYLFVFISSFLFLLFASSLSSSLLFNTNTRDSLALYRYPSLSCSFSRSQVSMASSDYIPALIPEDARPTPVKKLSGRELLQQTSINSILPTHDAFSVRGEESILVALQVTCCCWWLGSSRAHRFHQYLEDSTNINQSMAHSPTHPRTHLRSLDSDSEAHSRVAGVRLSYSPIHQLH